ncbi:hypothetical protein TNCV_3178211 [Trichonephila clavipes]|nr:hypothetical protein TNCV_3178211 [Trichonephila clavipes]
MRSGNLSGQSIRGISSPEIHQPEDLYEVQWLSVGRLMSTKLAWELNTGVLSLADHLTRTSAHAPQGPR